jgi:aromatic-L-amino-acid/L-tryptophan decarboxylase
MTPEEFRTAGHALIDWVADHRARVEELPVRSRVSPGEVSGELKTCPPRVGEPIEALFEDLERIVVPGLTQTQSPNFYGWFPSNGSLASVLGDIASGGLAGLGATWQSAPALTELEEVVCAWIRELTGLPESWRGTLQDTSSTGCLVALLAARERASGYAQEAGGLQAEPAPLVVYTSPHAHASVFKAVLLAGFGRDNLRLVDVDPVTYAVDPDALRTAMAADAAAGRRPAAVVVNLGTTGTTAFDPLSSIVPVAAEHGAWVHIDAAMAGSALLLPECRWMIEGIEDADSLSWNPHKWLGTILDCSLLYLRRPEQVIRVMATDPSYLRSSVDGTVTQFRDWGIPLGRRFRALKLWFHLRLDGLDAIRDRLRRDLENTAWLAGRIARTPRWRVLAPVRLQTICLRHEPPGTVAADGTVLDPAALDAHTLRWVEAVNASGEAFLTPAVLDGRWMVRISLGTEGTERWHVEELWRLVRRSAEGDDVLLRPTRQ